MAPRSKSATPAEPRAEPAPHVIGFDDVPFPRSHRGDVAFVGAAFAGARLDGVLTGRVRRDGANATTALIRCIARSRYAGHTHLIMLQGIALAGFNVVDINALHAALGMAVLVVARRRPDLARIEAALLGSVRGGARKWRLIERAGPMEPIAGVYVQRAGIGAVAARRAIEACAVNSVIPEPLRTAHLIASGIARMPSRQRV